MTKASANRLSKRARVLAAAAQAAPNGVRPGGTLFIRADSALEIVRERSPKNADLIAFLEDVCSRPNGGVMLKDGEWSELAVDDEVYNAEG